MNGQEKSRQNTSRQKKTITFYKMHGLGNDFMVIDRVTQHIELTATLIRRWADRHTGIGFDQLLLIDPPSLDTADFRFGIYNADGSQAQQCGNGTRCVALLAKHLRLTKKKHLTWQSAAGLIQTHFHNSQHIETTMTVPVLQADQVPFDERHAAQANKPANGTLGQYALQAGDTTYTVTPVSMGNPHGVLFVDDVQQTNVADIGARLTAHQAFPDRANIGFCQVVDRQFIRLRVYERGVGETRACGSGACAAVVAARCLDKVDEQVKISLPGGKLRVKWPGPGVPVTMSGNATLVYRGELTNISTADNSTENRAVANKSANRNPARKPEKYNERS